eukprot:10339601-Alexandrium_andersonii.AAC.1
MPRSIPPAGGPPAHLDAPPCGARARRQGGRTSGRRRRTTGYEPQGVTAGYMIQTPSWPSRLLQPSGLAGLVAPPCPSPPAAISWLSPTSA